MATGFYSISLSLYDSQPLSTNFLPNLLSDILFISCHCSLVPGFDSLTLFLIFFTTLILDLSLTTFWHSLPNIHIVTISIWYSFSDTLSHSEILYLTLSLRLSLFDTLSLTLILWRSFSATLSQPHYSFLFYWYVLGLSKKFKYTYVSLIILLYIFTFNDNIILFPVKIYFCSLTMVLKNGMIQEGGWPLFQWLHGYHWQQFVFDLKMKAMKYVMWVVFES